MTYAVRLRVVIDKLRGKTGRVRYWNLNRNTPVSFKLARSAGSERRPALKARITINLMKYFNMYGTHYLMNPFFVFVVLGKFNRDYGEVSS